MFRYASNKQLKQKQKTKTETETETRKDYIHYFKFNWLLIKKVLLINNKYSAFESFLFFYYSFHVIAANRTGANICFFANKLLEIDNDVAMHRKPVVASSIPINRHINACNWRTPQQQQPPNDHTHSLTHCVTSLKTPEHLMIADHLQHHLQQK